MRRFHSFICALSLWECLLAPHHWATNYMVGFCDTWGIYIKGFAGCSEPLAPIVATFKQNVEKSGEVSSYRAEFCPKRAQYHTIQLLYPLSGGCNDDTCTHERERFFDAAEFRRLKCLENAQFRVTLKRNGTPFYSSQWKQVKRYAFVHSSSDIYADHPFVRNAIYGELFLDGFDTSRFPWAYYSPLQVELEFRNLHVEMFDAERAILVVRVYNIMEL